VEGRGRFRASRTTFWWVWVEEEAAGARASTASGGCWSSGYGGGVAPVEIGRGGVGELRRDTAELLVGSARAERIGKGRATVSLRLAVVRWAVTAFWGFGAESGQMSEGKRKLRCSGC